MKRSGWVTGVIVMQFLYALGLFVLPVYLFVLTRTAGVRNGPDAAEDISGMKVAGAVLLLPALLAVVAWCGLWKKKLWGWWLALLCNLGLMSAFVYSMIDDGWADLDGTLVGWTAVFAVLCGILLLPPVRKFYWHGAPSEPAAGAGVA